MTFGLTGCTACVFVSNGKVHMMHDPIAEKVLQYIKRNYKPTSGSTILLKVPRDSYNWNEPLNKELWDKLKHLPIEFSLYSMGRYFNLSHNSLFSVDNFNFNSSLYVKMRDNGIYYTGRYGEWKLLFKTTSISSDKKADTDIKIAVSQTPTSQQISTPIVDITPSVPDWLPLLKAKIKVLERLV